MLKEMITFLLCGLALAAQSRGDVAPVLEGANPAKSEKKLVGLAALMPPGSQLKNVSLPRYKGRELIYLVTSTLMTVKSETELTGEEVKIFFYDPNGEETTKMSMKDVSYFYTGERKRIVSRGSTIINDIRFDASGQGMTFDINLKKGLMLGPIKTKFRFNQLKTKNISNS